MSDDQSPLTRAACASGFNPPKPKRPLTIFNLFSILERNFIVQQNQKRASASSNAPEDTNASLDPYLATRPERYRDVVLPPNWYVVGMNRVKRSKHKVHGVISFNDLTKEISNRWKSVDAETKQYCKIIAADELERYQRDMAAYEAKYGKDAVKAQKRKCDSQSNENIIAQNYQLLKSDGITVCTNSNVIGSQFSETVTGLAKFVARRDIPSQATAPQHWYACDPVPAQPDRGKSDENYQSTNSGAWSTCKPIGGQTKTNNVGEDNHSTNSAQGSGHSPTLSEYLPDDQEAALALVGNNYDNILHGEELEKAFDSD